MAAMTPTTMMMPRNSGAGSRRPSAPPTWPPTTEPAARSPAASHATWAKATKMMPATPLTKKASTFLVALSRWRWSTQEDAEQRQEDHALGRTEVPSVHAGEEHRPNNTGATVRQGGPCAVPGAPTGAAAAPPARRRPG